MGVSITELLILAVAVGFLVYAFTGSGRIVATVLFGGILVLIGAGLMGVMHQGRQRPLAEMAPQEGRPPPADRGQVGEVRLFDLKSHGRSFVIVLDTSAAMGEGGEKSPLHAAKKELRTGLHQLSGRGNTFQLISYDREPRPLIGGKDSLIAANSRSVADALQKIELLRPANASQTGGYRRHLDALQQAVKLKPDVIYWLTHGQDSPLSAAGLNSLLDYHVHPPQIYVAHLEWTTQTWKSGWLGALVQPTHYAHVVLHPAEMPESPPAAASAKDEKTSKEKPARPAWVDVAPQSLESASPAGVFRTTLHSKPKSTMLGCHESLDEQLHELVAEYADRFVERGAGEKLVDLDVVWDHVARRAVKETYSEVKDYGGVIENMLHLHARVEFDADDAAFLKRAWRESVQERRLWTLAAVVGLVLAVVGTIFGYLKTDTATRGYYSGRLKFAAAAALVLLGFLGFVLARELRLLDQLR
jgi:hypothetical protein